MRLNDHQAELFRAKSYAVIATLGDDGAPQTTIVWVDEEDGRPVFNTTNARAKGRNLHRDPRVSVLVWERGDPYRYIEVEGVAELEDDVGGQHMHVMSRKYTGKDFHTPVDRLIFRVTPSRIYEYNDD